MRFFLPMPALAKPILALGFLFCASNGFCAAVGAYYLQSAAEWFPGLVAHAALPTAEDLKTAGAVLVQGDQAWGDADRSRLEEYVKAGGGVVLVHDAIPASDWVKGEAKRWSGRVPLFFTPPGRGHAITRDISNFDVSDELMQGFEVDADSEVLATTWTPNRKHLVGNEPQPYVYGVSPMIWAKPWGRGRVVFFVPGRETATLQHPAIRAMLGRALAWAAGDPSEKAPGAPADAGALTYPAGGPLAPQEWVKSIRTHPDFVAELVASEPLISKPVNLDWDAERRLWVVESMEYPEGKRGGGPESMYPVWQRESNLTKPAAVDRPGRDRISRLEDTDGDGIMDTRHVFAEDLDLATSFCFYRDGVIVAQPPRILRLRDTDGDGRADRREVLYTGLGTQDTHSVLNNLRWGLDGWIYATHGYSSSPKVTSGDGGKDFGAIGSGVVRFKPDGSAIEMVSAKSGNCWGVDITSDGEWFFTQPTSGDLVMHVPVGDRLMAEGGMGSEPSWQVMVHLRPVKPLMTWEEIVENQPNDVIGSFTAACGCAIYEGGAWPEAWKLGYFTAEPTVHILHHEQLKRSGATFTAAKTRDEEFSATRDPWSRPIDTRIGPDGQLYSIDFYNQAILHNDPRGPIHLWNNQAARPDRDHFFGRIVRYRHRQSVALPAVNLKTLEGQVAALSHPNKEVRFRAQRLIEEGEVKIAAAQLAGAEGVAKLHALWIRAAAGVLGEKELTDALGNPDRAVRITAARVMAAHPELALAGVADLLLKETDAGVRLQLLAGLPQEAVVPGEVLAALQAGAEDRWTEAAIARLARNNTGPTLAAALAAPEKDKQVRLAARLFDFSATDESRLLPMLAALGKGGDPAMATACLASLSGRKLAGSAELQAALDVLVANPDPRIAAGALSIAARFWQEPDRTRQVGETVGRILASSPSDAATLTALGALPVYPPDLMEFFRQTLRQPEGTALSSAILANPSPKAADFLIGSLPSLAQAEKTKAFEALFGRPEAAIALVDALASGRLPAGVAGPQVIARLAAHPDERVRNHAAPVVAKFQGAVEAKSAIITRLLPEVSTLGDAAVGKLIFQSCAVCHLFRGEGAQIGPVLEGIGSHGVETLLTHIIDPNREVEPSYHVWNLGTKDGRILSGIISRETAGSIFLRNVGGETEVPRGEITRQEDTGKSLMPEGFESLGAESLRNLISYLRSGEQRFHILTFGKAATADGSQGVYLARDVAGDRVGLKQFGAIEERGIPFHLQDPATAPGGKNVIVLKGGAVREALSRTMPDRVEIPVNTAAGRLHLLGGVAGWGFPATAEQEPVVTVTVKYADDTSEEIIFRNGVDFADHALPVDVAGSARTDWVSHGQLRYLWRDLKKPTVPVVSLTLTSPGKACAPMIAAITLESPRKDGSMAPAPAEGGPSKP